MFGPVRLLYSFRPDAPLGILVADAVAATMFVATPFLVPEVATRFGVALGVAGLISTAQVGGFALAVLVAGRSARPSPGLLLVAAGLLVAVNAGSAQTGSFSVLLALRALAGAGAGLLSWVAWSEAVLHPRGLGDVAAVGPLAAMVASPAMGWMADRGGDPLVYLALAALSVPLLVTPVGLSWRDPGRVQVRSRSRSNLVLLAGLFLLTTAGSSVFVYAAAAVRHLGGVDALTAAGAYSLNAAAGIVATRFGPGRLKAGVWLASTAPCAMAIIYLPSPLPFYVAMGWWGFAFWIALPRIFRLLGERSVVPDEQVGRAQGLMATGRAIGPMVGGALLGDGEYLAMGAVAAGGTLVASSLTVAVEVQRERARAR